MYLMYMSARKIRGVHTRYVSEDIDLNDYRQIPDNYLTPDREGGYPRPLMSVSPEITCLT